MKKRLHLHLCQDLAAILIHQHLLIRLQHCTAELGRERFRYLHRLTNSRALNDNILHFLLAREMSQLREQVPT